MSTCSLRLMFLFCVLTTALTSGCGSTTRSAPVFDRAPAPDVTTPARPRQDQPGAQPASTKPTATAASPGAAKSTNTAAGAARQSPVVNQPRGNAAAAASEGRPYQAGDWRPDYYSVRKGDTLYSIALDFGHDYRDLAAWNSLANAAYIQVGQRLRLVPPEGAGDTPVAGPAATRPGSVTEPQPAIGVPTFSDPKAYRSAYSEQAFAQLQRVLAGEVETAVLATGPAQPKPAQPPPVAAPAKPAQSAKADKPAAADERLRWEWPAQGDLLYRFSEGPIKKGVGIQGQPGESVVSSAPGKVVYSGSGLRGYGNLLIVKHNATYLSVYAHNRQLLVSEGQMVAQGQKIAVMGETPDGHTALHFEIRRLGKPINPLEYLPDRAS